MTQQRHHHEVMSELEQEEDNRDSDEFDLEEALNKKEYLEDKLEVLLK